jgi:hypothetical protein
MNAIRRIQDHGRRGLAFLPLALVTGMILSCNLLSPQTPNTPTEAASAKPAVVPTATETPTATGVPEATNTPRPTADVAATQAARAAKTKAAETKASVSSLDDVSDQLSAINLSVGDGRLIWTYPEEYQIQSSDYNTIRWRVIESETAADFAFHSTIAWESEKGFAGCGFLFRVGEDTDVDYWYDMIINRLSGMPFAFFDLWKGDYVQLSSNPMFSNAIKFDQGDTNDVILTGKGNELSIYINRKKVGVWWNTKQMEGGFGFAVWANSGLTTCKFNDSWILEWK